MIWGDYKGNKFGEFVEGVGGSGFTYIKNN